MSTPSHLSRAVVTSVIASVITGVIMGGGVGYMTVKTTIAVVQKQIEYIEGDLLDVQALVALATANQTELARLSVWRDSRNQKDVEQDRRINNLESRMFNGGAR